MTPPETTPCYSCGADIHFVRTKAGARMPADPKLVTIITTDGVVLQGYTPHWATCPHADKHRKRQGRLLP